MNRNRSPIFFHILLVALVLTACAAPPEVRDTERLIETIRAAGSVTRTPVPPTQTSAPTDTPIPPTVTTTPTRTPPPTRTPLLTATQDELNRQATATQALVEIQATATQIALWPSVIASTFDKKGQGWWTGKTDDKFSKGEVAIAEGVYQYDVVAKKSFYWTVAPEMRSLTDFSVSVEAQQSSGPTDSDFGLVFHQTDDRNFYYFAIDNSQEFALLRIVKGEWTTLVDWKETPAIRPFKVNRLTVNGRDNRFELFINDQYVGYYTDSTLPKGKAGLMMDLYNADDHAVFVFDNFEVRAPGATTAASTGGNGGAGVTPQPGATTASAAASVYSATGGGPQGYTSYLGCSRVDGSPCQPVMAPGDISFSITLQSTADALLAIFLPFGLAVEKDGANAADLYMTVDAGWLPPDSQAWMGTSRRFTQPGHYVIRTNGCLMTEASYPNCSWWTVSGTVVTFDIRP